MAKSFSERNNFAKPKEIQVDGMDKDLLTALWNAFTQYFESVDTNYHVSSSGFSKSLFKLIWSDFLKLPLDGIRDHRLSEDVYMGCRKWFYSESTKWHERYDFLEFVAKFSYNDSFANKFTSLLNSALELEQSGYRFITGHFVPITNSDEMKEVDKATKSVSKALEPVSAHIRQAITLLSDKTKPDYRNSMKESISAIESLCKLITGMDKATLSPALEKTTKELGLNQDLRDGFKKIYSYTSDEHGVRHALKDMEHPEQEDARFFLIACSAFVNYIIEKARKQNKLPA